MLHPNTFSFLNQLKEHNYKEWFEANRNEYKQIRESLIQTTQNIIAALSQVDNTIKHIEAKDCLFRINRDVRFSNDKSPYKTNLGISIAMGGKKFEGAGYYIHIEPEKSFIGGGVYMPQAELLKQIRQEIVYNWPQFNEIITHPNFIKTYQQISQNAEYTLQKTPKGFSDFSEEIAPYIKLKSWIATTACSNNIMLSEQFVQHAVNTLSSLTPLIHFLNQSFT